MNVPARPTVKFEPKLADFTEHPATLIVQALDQLFECSFRTDQSQHTHLMDQAHTAPQVLAHALEELFYLRREVALAAARAADEELAAADDELELTPEGQAVLDEELAAAQRPLADRCAAAIAEEAELTGNHPPNRQSSTANRQSRSAPATSDPPPSYADLEADVALLHQWNNQRGQKLHEVKLLAGLAGELLDQLTQRDFAGILHLITAIVDRPDVGQAPACQPSKVRT